MINRVKILFKELFTPSNNKNGEGYRLYVRSLIAAMHCALGIACTYFLMLIGASFAVAGTIVVVLYILKELLDIYAKGTVADSLEDLLAVIVGVSVVGTTLMPFGPLLAFIIIFMNGKM